MTNEQIEQLSETFLKQMNSLSDVEFVKSPFAIKEMLSLKKKIFKDNEKKSDEEIKTFLKDFSEDGKNFTEYRKDIEAQLSKIMSPESLNELNSLISEALTKLEKNEYWQSINHPKEQFNATQIELCLPENRTGRCFRAKMNDGSYEDVVTINPIAYINYLNNCKVEDKLTCTEAFIIHELTHGDQYNRMPESDIPTDYMPNLLSQKDSWVPKYGEAGELLLDALWEADTRSTACLCILKEGDVASKSIEEVIQMQLRGKPEIKINTTRKILEAKDHKELFFEVLRNYTSEFKKVKHDKFSEDEEYINEFIGHIYDKDKYGDYDDFVQEVSSIIKEANSIQVEVVREQKGNNESINNSETDEGSRAKTQQALNKIEELRVNLTANKETAENGENNNQNIKELRGISSFTKAPYKPKEIIVNPQTLRLYQDKMQNS